jgi:hypothetical protein
VTPGEKRGAPWLLFWTAILGFAMSLVADIALERKNARLTRALAARPAAVLRPHAIARLATWGKRDKGLAWGIVAIPDTGWHNGDTMILITDRAKMEVKP